MLGSELLLYSFILPEYGHKDLESYPSTAHLKVMSHLQIRFMFQVNTIVFSLSQGDRWQMSKEYADLKKNCLGCKQANSCNSCITNTPAHHPSCKHLLPKSVAFQKSAMILSSLFLDLLPPPSSTHSVFHFISFPDPPYPHV